MQPPADLKQKVKAAKKEGPAWEALRQCLESAVPAPRGPRQDENESISDADSFVGGDGQDDFDEALFGDANAGLDEEAVADDVMTGGFTGRNADAPGIAKRVKRRTAMPSEEEILAGGASRFVDTEFMGEESENVPPVRARSETAKTDAKPEESDVSMEEQPPSVNMGEPEAGADVEATPAEGDPAAAAAEEEEEDEESVYTEEGEEVGAPDERAMGATEDFIWELDEDDEVTSVFVCGFNYVLQALAGALLGL